MVMQIIKTQGITYLEPLDDAQTWYWGTDCTSGDLYEAEELFRMGHRIRSNRLVLVRAEDGHLFEPVKPKEGQYFGRPAYAGGAIVLLLADFPAGEIRLLRVEPEGERITPIVTLPRSAVEDCYNLMPHTAPLSLTRQAGNRFQIIWPERADFAIGPTETFCFRDGERLYFSRWHEDPDYREEAVVRAMTGEILEETPGSLLELPGGRKWLLV